MIVLENEGFRVEINPFGAELTSFKSKTTGTEYVWGGDPAAWKRHAPVLFPIVGRLKDKTYTADGASFEITQHGFDLHAKAFVLHLYDSFHARRRLAHQGAHHAQRQRQHDVL